MEYRKPTIDERRLLLELARIGRMADPEAWIDALKVREMKDGGMGSLEIEGPRPRPPSGVVVPKASVQFSDEDGVEVVATLNADETGVPTEIDIWKTDFSRLRRIPTSFRRLEG
jgi:hypothetical protein